MAKRRDSVDLSPPNKLDLLGFLDEMPPESGDVSFDTSQKKYWQDLLARFSDYLGSFDGDRTIFQKWDKHYLERIDAIMMLYLSLYSLLHFAWESDIIPSAANSHVDLSKILPLNFLKEIIFSDWEIEEAKYRTGVKPTLREIYNFLLKTSPAKLHEIEGAKHPKNRQDRLLGCLWELLPGDFVRIKYLELFCEYAFENSENPKVKECLAEYRKKTRDYMDIIKKIAKSSTVKNSQTSTKLF